MSTIQKHTQWMRHMQDQGWSYGDEHSLEAKKHPRMKPWELLTEQEQADFIAMGEHHLVTHEPAPEEDEPEAEPAPNPAPPGSESSTGESTEPDALDQPAPEPDHNG